MSSTRQPMSEPTPYDDFSPGPHRDRLRREYLEFQAEWRELQARMDRRSAEQRVRIAMIKQQEAALARRRCWLF